MIARIVLFFLKHINNILITYYNSKIAQCGNNSVLGGLYSHYEGLENIYVGNNVQIPQGSTFYTTNAKIRIGNNVLFGPNPTIITGNHRIDVIGEYINNVTEKLPDNDKDVVIGDDCWIGANVTILKGVEIGHGSVVAAGSVVTKSCEPYSVIGGVPARLIKMRFNEDEIIQHENKLNNVKTSAEFI